MQIDQNQPDQPDRDVDEEDHAPVQITDDQTSGDGSKHGSDQGWDRDEAHGAEEISLGERPDKSKPAYGHHHGAAAALQDAASNEHVNVARYSAEEGPESEKPDGCGKHTPRTESIRNPTADRDKYGEAQRITGEYRFHAERTHMKRCRDRWNCGIKNCGIERLHEKRNRDQPWQQPFAGDGAARRSRGPISGTP